MMPYWNAITKAVKSPPGESLHSGILKAGNIRELEVPYNLVSVKTSVILSLAVEIKEGMPEDDKWQLLSRCLCAGVAGSIADIATHPVETAKVRLQIQGETLHRHTDDNRMYRGMIHALLKISQFEGINALYNGLFTSIQRQFVYSSIRIGGYQPVKRFYLHIVKETFGGNLNKVADTCVRILAASTVGAVGVVLTQPLDVVKVRFQAMNTQSGQQQRYSGIINAYSKIFREEGFRGLMSGTSANVVRNCVCSSSELVAYDIIKENLLKQKMFDDNIYCHLSSALFAGMVATIVTCPADVIKARLMNSGNAVYTGALHCATVMLRNEGPAAFYKGFVPLYCRMGSWGIVMFLSYEQLKKFAMPGNR